MSATVQARIRAPGHLSEDHLSEGSLVLLEFQVRLSAQAVAIFFTVLRFPEYEQKHCLIFEWLVKEFDELEVLGIGHVERIDVGLLFVVFGIVVVIPSPVVIVVIHGELVH